MEASKVFFVTNAESFYLFKDLCEVPNIRNYVFWEPKNSWIRLLRKVHCNPTLAKYLRLPARDAWFDFQRIDGLMPEDGYLLVNSSAMCAPTMDFWRRLKKRHPDARFVLILVDSLHGSSKHMPECIRRLRAFSWDQVLSYDRNDCETYGFSYIGFSYYSDYTDVHPSVRCSDLYCISSLKGRQNIYRELAEQCSRHKVDSLMKIYSPLKPVDFGVRLSQMEAYDKVVADVMSANCLLEVVGKGQGAQTLRYLEALCYNKKLLSNNPCLKELPYYDSNYMRQFNDIDDIDWDWVKKKEPVRYVQRPSFSSARLLEFLT